MDMTEWADIDGATAATYAPQEEDEGYYLRAAATYSDGLGDERDSASAESAFPVELRPTANFAPSFEIQDDTGPEVDDVPDVSGDDATTGVQDNIVVNRMVKETAKVGASVGNAVTATDADNDPLIYRLSGVDTTLNTTDDTGNATTETVDSGDLFKIDRKTGQISVKDASKLDFEAYATTLDVQNTDDVNERALEYKVNVTATDPSGAVTDPSPQEVTIKVTAVNEPPVITRTPAGGLADAATIIAPGGSLLLIDTKEENPLNPIVGGGAGTADPNLPVFRAVDPEEPDSTDIDWSLTGADAGRFQIVKLATEVVTGDADPTATNTAALRWDGDAPSFEAMDSEDGTNVYEVVVRASDGVARETVTVRVTVENIEELGKVSLTQRVPQEGIPVTASLTDPDGNISGTEWQWYRVTLPTDDGASEPVLIDSAGDRNPDGIDTTGNGTADETSITKCSAASPSVICAIDDGTSGTYIPTRADAKRKLVAWATYVDELVSDVFTVGAPPARTRSMADDRVKDGEDGDTANVTSEHPSRARPNANTRPRFLNKGPEEREVAENEKGASVGDPVAGIDADPLIHTLSGDDAASFKIGKSSGQITTAEKLDYETKSSYTVTVTATDPSLSSASITVNITVTDEDDAATVILLTGNAPAFAAEEMTRSVAENTAAGTAIGDPVAATDEDGDTLTYSLWGEDAGSFDIDSATGQLMTKAALDYETKMSYTVTVTASDGEAEDATTTVTIMVTDEGLDNVYDMNEDGTIQRDEVIAAIHDYLADTIDRSEVVALIHLYYANGG